MEQEGGRRREEAGSRRQSTLKHAEILFWAHETNMTASSESVRGRVGLGGRGQGGPALKAT